MFVEIASKYNQSFKNFHPFPPITDRAAWDSLDIEWLKKAVELGEKYLCYAYPYSSATDFMDFLRTGNRVRFERKYFSKRHALNALVLAECVENKGRFSDDIINGIFSICDECAWQLPPHNSYVRDTPQLPLPDVTAPVLDLFACETGALLGTVYYLIKSVLDETSPFISKRILYELQNRIFVPYLNNHFWWMGNGKEPMNNWTVWCTQNILLSIFLTSNDMNLKRNAFQKASRSIDYFLAEYGDDGCCDEGAQYYRHAGLCLFNLIELYNAVTNDSFAALYQNPKIYNIASYILNAHINDKYYINFADCSPVAGRAGAREFLFAKRIGNEDMARFAAIDFKEDFQNSLLLDTEINLYYRLQNAFAIAQIKAYDTSLPVRYSDIYYPSVGLFSVRDTHYHLAVKAGDNADSHNHNDTGSFTVYKDGKPLIIDIGVESYTQKTFSPERYEIWSMQSAYHNLPTVNGFMQMNGEEYRASNIIYDISNSICKIEMDIADAYPKECNLLSYHRKVTLIKDKEIVVKDCFSFSNYSDSSVKTNQVILSLMTYEKPQLREDNLITIGTLGTLKVKGGTLLQIEEIPIHDQRLMITWEHEIYRILIMADKSEIEITIS